MAYEIYVDHPESQERQKGDFTSWIFWSRKNAPWTGIGVHTVAALLEELAQHPDTEDLRDNLDYGGSLSHVEAGRVVMLAGAVLGDEPRDVFEFAARHRYPVLVEYTNPIGVSLHASDLHRGSFGDASLDPDPHSDAVDLGDDLVALYAPVPAAGAQPPRPLRGLPRGYPLFFPREGQSVLRLEVEPRPYVYLQDHPGGTWYPMNDDGSVNRDPQLSMPDPWMREAIETHRQTGGPDRARILHPSS